jgi:probable phosphoglycerate mutase
MTKIIYFIRHGQTEFNRLGIVQGSGVDSDLNDLGQAQASAFYNKYQGVKFDKIYVSALKRTHQSVKDFLEAGIPSEIQAGLNEISWGDQEGKVPNQQDDVYYKSLLKHWQDGQTDLQAINGESPAQVRARQIPVISHILAQTQEQTVLVAMHGRALRIILTTIFDQPLAMMDSWEHSNLCLYKIAFHTDSQNFELLSANDTTHLD